MKIAEIYRSIQGEGLLTGTESVFVRTSGCNLRCWFCDTPFTSWAPEGEELPVDKIMAQVERLECNHVVLTGGEPLLWADAVALTQALQSAGRHVTVETAGTVFLPIHCDLLSLSPKFASSAPASITPGGWHERHQRARHAPAVIRRMLGGYVYQMKFVVDTPPDCQSVEQYLAEFPEIDRGRVLLMPQGTSVADLSRRAEWLEPYCTSAGFRYCPRRQIEWFGLTRGT
ncbi:MAG: 7-carboxy-7-deazaguanine synthase QueE [Pirellulales bacterium]